MNRTVRILRLRERSERVGGFVPGAVEVGAQERLRPGVQRARGGGLEQKLLQAVLERRALADASPRRRTEKRRRRLREPVDKARLIDELRLARVMLYKGDINETFCLAVAEAQCMGVPTVVQPIGSMTERVRHDETGFIAPDDDAFALAARRLLTDDALWRAQHDRALDVQRSWRWAQAAAAFEELISSP